MGNFFRICPIFKFYKETSRLQGEETFLVKEWLNKGKSELGAKAHGRNRGSDTAFLDHTSRNDPLGKDALMEGSKEFL